MNNSNDGKAEGRKSRKRRRQGSKSSDQDEKDRQCKKPMPTKLETDPAILERRQKQIDYGKNTIGYSNYTDQTPSDKRTKDDPRTPDKYYRYSRRSWDQLIKIWRKRLHEYDPNSGQRDDDDDDDT